MNATKDPNDDLQDEPQASAQENTGDAGNATRRDPYGTDFEPRKGFLALRMLRNAALRVGERPVAGLGIRVLRRAEHYCLRSLRDRLDEIGGPADPLGSTATVGYEKLPSQILNALLQASRGTDQQAVERDFFVRLLRQLNPSQARILVLMADGAPWPMVHVVGTPMMVGERQRALSFASSVGTEAGVLLRAQVPHFLAHMYSLGLLNVGPEDEDMEPQYEILEASTPVRDALRHVQDDLNLICSFERHTIRLSEFGQALCEAALPDTEH